MYPLWYSEEERRRSWPAATATPWQSMGWAERRRPAALLVARVLVFEYATLLAPCGPRRSAQRGRGRFWDAL